MNLCTGQFGPTDLPEEWPDEIAAIEEGWLGCCMGSAERGPRNCTCWQAIYDLTQNPKGVLPVAPSTREEMCHDCAYRPRSPERSGDPNARYGTEDLLTLASGDNPFWCHQGMRRIVGWFHPPTGTYRPEPDQAGYEPPQVDGVPYKADGTPGDKCAGWAKMRERQSA
jgi:hypothetical protein